LPAPSPDTMDWRKHSATIRNSFSDLEHLDVRWTWGRGVRRQLVAGLGFALALPALTMAAQSSNVVATETALTADTQDLNGRTETTLTISVTGKDGQAAQGPVVISDNGKQIAGVVLGADGRVTTTLSLTPGAHSLSASYAGDVTHQASTSLAEPVAAATPAAPSFGITVAPATVTLTPGQSGNVVATITPVNASSLTAPLFVTLSCSGLPDEATCTFTPQNVEILPNQTSVITSSMVLTTEAGNSRLEPPLNRDTTRTALAILLPGSLGLAGLAFGARRKRWLSRISLLAMVALIGVLGTAGCNPLYDYRNHGPSPTLPTPAGTFNLLVVAQSSNGVTAFTTNAKMVLTVQ
jgi:hypothetical protein